MTKSEVCKPYTILPCASLTSAGTVTTFDWARNVGSCAQAHPINSAHTTLRGPRWILVRVMSELRLEVFRLLSLLEARVRRTSVSAKAQVSTYVCYSDAEFPER